MKNIESLEGLHVRAFLEYKIEAGVAHSTFSQYAAACSKLEQALNLYAVKNDTSRTYDITRGLADVRREAHAELRRFNESRAYANPEKLIQVIDASSHRLAAVLQLEGGARISEAAFIRQDQLRGFTTEPVTGRAVGAFHVRSKGGHQRNIYVAPRTYQALERHIAIYGEFRIDKNDYRQELRQAANLSGQSYNGSHGLRHNAAQRYYAEVQKVTADNAALTAEQALLATAIRLGHSRPSISKIYLR